MKNDRFIELLNLYVDQQLDAREAAELEKELQRDPSRRRTYVEYCRMQKACSQLFESDRACAPVSGRLAEALAEADGKVLNLPHPASRPVVQSGWWAAGLGVAACAVFAVMRLQNPSAGPAGDIVASVPASEEPVTIAQTPTAIPDVSVNGAEPQFFSVMLPQQQATSFVSTRDKATLPVTDIKGLEWTRRAELPPIRKVSTEEFLLGVSDRAPAAQPHGPVLFQNKEHHQPAATDTAAFQFQR
jgi:hypothetical protein